ncbi:MAG: hypothetical protein PUG93_06135, partial [Oscillospiraceae bacterium]|nr:hypothetical protein [Oscillospiraceae bacterium]
ISSIMPQPLTFNNSRICASPVLRHRLNVFKDNVKLQLTSEIINKIDRDGKSDFEITSELGNVMIWNCRNYRTDCDNYLLKGDAESIRYGYEEYED